MILKTCLATSNAELGHIKYLPQPGHAQVPGHMEYLPQSGHAD